jgi:hypothetical protein
MRHQEKQQQQQPGGSSRRPSKGRGQQRQQGIA